MGKNNKAGSKPKEIKSKKKLAKADKKNRRGKASKDKDAEKKTVVCCQEMRVLLTHLCCRSASSA